MHAIHERALHEKLDRMLVAGLVEEIREWRLEFEELHRNSVNRKAREVEAMCARVPGGTRPAFLNMRDTPPSGDMRAMITHHVSFMRHAQRILSTLASHHKGFHHRTLYIPPLSGISCHA